MNPSSQHNQHNQRNQQIQQNQTFPNASIYSYARGNQVQQYPYSNYNEQQQSINYSNYNPTVSQYPNALNVTNSNFVQPINPLNPLNQLNSTITTPTTAQQFFNRLHNFINTNHHLNSSLNQPHLNSSLHQPYLNSSLNQPHSIDLNDSLSAQINSWLADYNLWQETVKRSYNQANKKNLIPLKFEKTHSSLRFGNSNQLITVTGKSIYIQNIKPILIESAENTLINTWPGPLIKDQSNKNDVIEYVKGQEKIIISNNLPEYHYLNLEKSQIWQLLSMMIKQNGDLSSSELAEFLISKNESEFYTDDGGTELGKFRRFLLLGQKKNALDYARKNGLWGHSFALAYLISNPQFNEIMINSVNDFTDSTLSKDDPIFTLYRRLLQNLQKENPELLNSICTMLPPSNLQQFTILLANGCEISPNLPGSAFTSEVLKLIVALRDGKSTFIDLNSLENFFLRNLIKEDKENYSEELLFMNEIYEFCQKPNLPLIEIIPFKVLFAAKLYDYGLINQAKKYCELIIRVYETQLRYRCYDSEKMNKINWNLIMYIIEFIISKIDKELNVRTITSHLTSPASNSSQQEIRSGIYSEEDNDNLEEESESNQESRLDYRFEDLNLNRDFLQNNQHLINNNPVQQQQQPFQSKQPINQNQIPQFRMTNQQQQQNLNKQPQQQNQQVDQRERSDSVQSIGRQRTISSRASSNVSNFISNKQEIQQNKNQFNQPSAPLGANKQPQQFKNNDNLPNVSLASSNNLPTSNITKTVKPVAPQPTFFVPKFSPSDNLPPIDFVSKPIEPTNLLEEDNNDEQLNNEKQNSLPGNQTLPNFNSTLNPPMPNQQSISPQNHLPFSPAVSPITSPVMNTNQNSMNNLGMQQQLKKPQPDNLPMNLAMQQQFKKQQQSQQPDISSLDQTDNDLKNKEKSGFMSSINSW